MNDANKIKIGETIKTIMDHIDILHEDETQIIEIIKDLDSSSEEGAINKLRWTKRLYAVRAWITDNKQFSSELINMQRDL